MKLIFLLKKIIKISLLKINFLIFRIDNEEAAYNRLKLFESKYKKKRTFVNYLIKKYPSNPFFTWERFLIAIRTAENNYINYLREYAKKKNLWLKKSNLDKINLEFVNEKIVVGSLGNIFPLFTLLMANKLNLRDKKKIVLLLTNKLTNKVLFDYFKDYLLIIRDETTINKLSKISESLDCNLGSALEFKNNKILLPSESHNYVEKEMKNKNIKLLSTKEEHLKLGKKQLELMNIPGDAWYVTLHMRESSYRKNNSKEINESFRNVDPTNYLPAIKLITDSGGYVFRMGNAGMTPLKNTTGLIDYANSKYRSELMDVFLGSTSKFCLATSSGYYAIPKCFSVPVLLADCPNHLCYFELGSTDLYLPRLFKFNENDKLINFNKIFLPPFNNLFNDKMYNKFKVSVIPNTPDEIKLATQEIIDRVVFKKLTAETDLQKKVNNKIESSIKTNTDLRLTPSSIISSNFLEKYKYLI